MKKYSKYIGLIYFFIDTLIQICFFSYPSLGLAFNETIKEYGFFNSFVLWFFAEAIFGEDSVINLLFVVFILCIVSLIALLIALIFNRKIAFLILLFYCVLNVVFHIFSLPGEQYTYIGLIYKIVGCITYIYCLNGIKNQKCPKKKGQGTEWKHWDPIRGRFYDWVLIYRNFSVNRGRLQLKISSITKTSPDFLL